MKLINLTEKKQYDFSRVADAYLGGHGKLYIPCHFEYYDLDSDQLESYYYLQEVRNHQKVRLYEEDKLNVKEFLEEIEFSRAYTPITFGDVEFSENVIDQSESPVSNTGLLSCSKKGAKVPI